MKCHVFVSDVVLVDHGRTAFIVGVTIKYACFYFYEFPNLVTLFDT